MKTKLLALAFLAVGSSFAATRFSIGINIGGGAPGYYAPPPAYVAARPPCPDPDYSWTEGYWTQGQGRGTWVNGYWNRSTTFRSYQAAPDYGRRGYDNRRFDRDDRHDRDHDRGRGNAYGNGFRNR